MPDRAVSSTLGIALLLLVTVVLAATVGAVALASVPAETATPTPVALAVSASDADDRLTFTHRAGPTLAVDELTVRVSVDGTPLDNQPPVPFFSATGFRSGPTGPFNVASDGGWSAGETASLRVASTNSPALEPGHRVTVRIAVDGNVVAQLSTTVS
ncbi:flagellin N-terminal-like domain-containing protein [Halogranum amylolyticum]|uniref:Flagellin N-terminal-like domain-containing protein n=1 Tax=Halogranum amylolyticum TaxID=660520 RepID=A0A1H8QJR4_9EURY|nr:type IV pilin [Halogranum amylolyticum]SEO54449.1 flagellin N-terminal-like domain-containing protein [Halogranum amylolyticum]